ncbi:hypothetical protein [Pseudogemmobacter faecipullorum]|uniref:Uncharacterized protein n=1 Tax=Pseudogemmobacter faecipullorum TaxID=2755041 RepID=A0ABS8CIE1_9RHOB|nr:hypothetical protein [Pseudogemmobacter faecipullorum]MCB5409164.1 hypothetical protein [Pseudogemmobacter faecipullorum]
MPNFISTEIYNRLLVDLSGAFMAAATSTGADLNDKLAEALACAGVLPEACRGDFEGRVPAA